MKTLRFLIVPVVLCLLKTSAVAASIVGSWSFTLPGESHVTGVITFLSDGTYFHAEGAHLNDAHPAGMERGTYAWNPNTGSFTCKTLEDSNGNWGLSDQSGKPAITITVNGDTFSVSGQTFNRVTSATNPLVGSWFASGVGIITFLSDGTYFEAEAFHKDPIGTHQHGMERGTYTWNSNTGAFSFTTLEDTNGDWGLSDSGINAITVSNGILTAASSTGDPGPAYQVTTAPFPGVGIYNGSALSKNTAADDTAAEVVRLVEIIDLITGETQDVFLFKEGTVKKFAVKPIRASTLVTVIDAKLHRNYAVIVLATTATDAGTGVTSRTSLFLKGLMGPAVISAGYNRPVARVFSGEFNVVSTGGVDPVDSTVLAPSLKMVTPVLVLDLALSATANNAGHLTPATALSDVKASLMAKGYVEAI